MPEWNEGARKTIETLAAKHGVSTEAAEILLRALAAGQGRQAQFNHPDLGGMGQWSQGGMTMIGDMFNHDLKARVDALARDLSDAMGRGDIEMNEPARSGSAKAHGGSGRWPKELGTSGASGSQNDMHYAVFPETRRLAVEQGGRVTIYDTGDHRISGVSQAQSGSASLSFASQHGPVVLDSLKQVAAPEKDTPSREPDASPEPVNACRAESHEDVFAKIERLHELRRKDVLSQEEFDAKKKELLSRL